MDPAAWYEAMHADSGRSRILTINNAYAIKNGHVVNKPPDRFYFFQRSKMGMLLTSRLTVFISSTTLHCPGAAVCQRSGR
jgi:hypothetical protein